MHCMVVPAKQTFLLQVLMNSLTRRISLSKHIVLNKIANKTSLQLIRCIFTKGCAIICPPFFLFQQNFNCWYFIRIYV